MATETPVISIEQTREERVRLDLARAGVPERFRDRRLDRYYATKGSDQERALQAARAVVDERKGLLLLGSVGTGKTHLATGICLELAEQGRLYERRYGRLNARFVVVPELLDELRRAVRHDVVDPLEPLLSVPLLILDDLGAEKVTEWVVDRLYVLINHRYNAQFVTVATSNYTLAELAGRGYERMVSRLVDGATVVTIDGPDRRVGGAR